MIMCSERRNAILCIALILYGITEIHTKFIKPKKNKVCRTEKIHDRITLNCSHENLTYIPKTKESVQSLIFGYNYLTNITSESFVNLSNPEVLVELKLDHNNIKNISSDSLQNFTNLKYLHLSNNPIFYNDLKNLFGTLSELKYLTQVRLSEVPTVTLVPDLFSLLKPNQIETLDATGYRLERFSLGTFDNFNHLRSLFLMDNHIGDLILSRHQYLRSLYVDHNNIKCFPNFSVNGSDTDCFMPKLEILDIQSNSIDTLNSGDFRCLQKLRSLTLSGNPVKVLQTNLLHELPSLDYLQLRYLRGGRLYIEPFAFNSTSLKTLRFGIGYAARDVFISFNDTFRLIPNLRNLVIYRINMLEVTDEQMTGLFAPLVNLTYFSCFGCQITQDPKIILQNMKLAFDVRLQGNMIKTLSKETFAANKDLKYLNLRYNQIGHIKEDTLPDTIRNKLHKIDISKNAFICDCELKWFIDWLNSISIKRKIGNYPTDYICSKPEERNQMLLSQVTFTYRECNPLSTWTWAAIIISPIAVVVFLVAIIVYRNRWNIKHYIYLLRKRKHYQAIPENDIEFDAFVAYKAEDSRWIHETLLPILEGEVGLKLCIHDRNFKLGYFINDNITNNMDKSKKIILILTNSFARSDWCRFELKVALTKKIEDGKVLVVVLLEKIEARNMNSSIKALLNTTTYIEWTEDVAGQELFWMKMRDVFKN